jgi:hypothetical protein
MRQPCSGTATGALPDSVTVYLDSTGSTPLGKDVFVLAGNPQTWDVTLNASAPAPGAHLVIMVSSRGSTVTGTLTVRKEGIRNRPRPAIRRGGALFRAGVR